MGPKNKIIVSTAKLVSLPTVSPFFNHLSPRRPVSDKKKISVDHTVDRLNHATDRRFGCFPLLNRDHWSLQISEQMGKSSMKKEYGHKF